MRVKVLVVRTDGSQFVEEQEVPDELFERD